MHRKKEIYYSCRDYHLLFLPPFLPPPPPPPDFLPPADCCCDCLAAVGANQCLLQRRSCQHKSDS